jgi:hypothetical protein
VQTAPGILSEVEDELLNIRDNQSVDWAGKLAGFKAGYMTHGDLRLLIVGGPNIIAGKAGEWTNLRHILEHLFIDEVQVLRFNLWLKVAYEALRDGRTQAGQLVVLCGPWDCMKSYLHNT